MRILAETYTRCAQGSEPQHYESWEARWTAPAAPELWTTGDAARVLRVSRAAIRKFVRLRQLACYARLRSGLRLFRPDDVKDFAHARVDAGLVTVRARRLKPQQDARQQRLFDAQLRMVKVLSPRRSRFTLVNRKPA